MNIIIKNLVILNLMLFCSLLFSQVGINTETPDESSVLDIKGEKMGAMFPKIYLNSITDNTTIKNPKESLIVFNTNPQLFQKKSLVFWDGSQWSELFKDIESASETGVNNVYSYTSPKAQNIRRGFYLKAHHIGEGIDESWDVLTDFIQQITLNKNADILLSFSGTLQLNNNQAGSLESSFGVFVDGKLSNIKVFKIDYLRSAYYDTFSQNFLLKDIPAGKHEIKIAVGNRKSTNEDITVRFGGYNQVNLIPRDIVDDETRMNMNLFIYEK